MNDKDTSNVQAAFQMLLEEMNIEVKIVRDAGSKAFTDGALDTIREALTRAEKMEAFQEKVQALRAEWEKIAPVNADRAAKAERRNLGRAEPGTVTSDHDYEPHVLAVLVELGGRAAAKDVVNRVLPRVKDRLVPLDFAPMPSDPDCPRWRNATHWARNFLRKKGYIRPDSPRGIWEITQAGRDWLAEQS
jgi:hypothetical protein